MSRATAAAMNAASFGLKNVHPPVVESSLRATFRPRDGVGVDAASDPPATGIGAAAAAPAAFGNVHRKSLLMSDLVAIRPMKAKVVPRVHYRRFRIPSTRSNVRPYGGHSSLRGREPRLVEHGHFVAEREERSLAVVGADPRVADAAERQILVGEVPERVVDGHAARGRLRKHLVAPLGAVAEVVERERMRPRVDARDRFVERAERLDRQQRSEDLLLHHRHGRRDADDQRRRELARVRAGALSPGRIDLDDARTLRARVVDERRQPPVVALVDDRRVVGIGGERRVAASDRGLGLQRRKRRAASAGTSA